MPSKNKLFLESPTNTHHLKQDGQSWQALDSDPYWTFDTELDEGLYRLSFTYSCKEELDFKVYYDSGQGFSEDDTFSTVLPAVDLETQGQLSINLPDQIRAIMIHPCSFATTLTMADFALEAQKSPLLQINGHATDMLAANHLEANGDDWISTGIDPFFIVKQGLEAGWYEFRWRGNVETPINMKIYFHINGLYNEQYSCDWQHIKLAEPQVVYFLLNEDCSEFMIHPTDQAGRFTMNSLHLRKLDPGAILKKTLLPQIHDCSNVSQLLSFDSVVDLCQDELISTMENSSDASLAVVGKRKESSINQSEDSKAVVEGFTEKFHYKPLISIVMPVYNPPIEFLKEAIESCIDQAYPHWELCIGEDCSTNPEVVETLKYYESIEPRVRVNYRKENGHISAASNSAIEIAKGEFMALLDHDDLLHPTALFEAVQILNSQPDTDMIYTDEDKIDESGARTMPYFKPDWSPDTFLTKMYTCHFGIYRMSIIREIGGFRLGLEGSQDYDLVLRFSEKTIDTRIQHIPKILYHWRIHSESTAGDASTKTYAYDAGKKALRDTLERRGLKGTVSDCKILGHYDVRLDIIGEPLVSIIIPTRDYAKITDDCLRSLFKKTDYSNYEVILLDNGSVEEETLEMFKKWQVKEPERFKLVRYDIPFNYSLINNYAAEQAQGEHLLFLNNDTEIINPDWLRALLELSQLSHTGCIGAKLLYPDDTIQHAGVVMGLGGGAGHSHLNFHKDHPGYFYELQLIRNYSAVTAACLMLKKEIFTEIKGFDPDFQIAFNDVDLCLKVKELGYHNVYTPNSMLYHYESKSRGFENTPDKLSRFAGEVSRLRQRWQHYIEHDPCYNPNLTLGKEDFSTKE